MRKVLRAVVCEVLLGCGADVRRVAADEPPAVDWRAEAAKAGLPAAWIETLARGRLVVGASTAQIFLPYVDHRNELPAFITSDSVLHVFHVLLEESLSRVEGTRASQIGPLLARIALAIPEGARGIVGPQPLLAAGRLRATRILGVALALLGREGPGADAADLVAIREEAARVTAGVGRAKPEWLGPPDRAFFALDYGRFRPGGTYTRSAALQRYWRAVAWLQAIPLRVSSDEELATAVFLHAARQCAFLPKEEATWDALLRLRGLLPAGRTDCVLGNPPLPEDLSEPALTAFRATAAKEIETETVNDRVAYEPAGPTLRVFPSVSLPDAVLLQRTAGVPDSPRPDALAICAMLGDARARARLLAAVPAAATGIDEARVSFEGSSVYERHLRCLSALLDPPETGAPALFGAEAWARKNCGTALASWAQGRHAFALAASETTQWLGHVDGVPGFVEPDPEFFARLAHTVTAAAQASAELDAALGGTQGMVQAAREALAIDCRVLAGLLEKQMPAGDDGDAFWRSVPPEELPAAGRAYEVVFNEAFRRADMKEGQFWIEIKRGCLEVARMLEDAGVPLTGAVAYAVQSVTAPLEPRWAALRLLAHRLEALAHKQLRGVAFSEEEAALFHKYGETLAHLMRYVGNSYIFPDDDAPRAASVFVDQRGERWIVGTGRPRKLFLLYPSGGRDHLCVGAVLSFLETWSTEPLSDDQWIGRIDAGGSARPRPPEWLRSVYPDE